MVKKTTQDIENQSGELNKETAKKPTASFLDILSGDKKITDEVDYFPYLPQELIGGSIPYVAGLEDEAVWNAASQACGTERVHYVYTIEENKCWYLACPSSALASNPDSWCPIAAALPGNSEYWDQETVYIYEQEGMACALRWDPDTHRMQVFLGAGRTILPRIQSMNANFATINPENATIVPWRNRQLNTEKLARATSRMLLLSGIIVVMIMALFLAGEFVYVNSIKRDLGKIRQATEKASGDLMVNAYNALQSDVIKHFVRVQDIVDKLDEIQGWLVRYEVKDGKAEWEVIVDKAFSSGVEELKTNSQPTLEPDGRIRIKGEG
jgi:hypothetical protein